ncbi:MULTISPECIES: hypothetical protein [Rhizobium]|uniref:hypothetical protein n=1 Tax=Rhizobium TaxID=379 RepID=UPI00195C5340|nr:MULTISPECIES: hypothetical protein [Rhizobium]MBM7044911.1 hypothetical protein [Rhizobium lusitanum]
MAEFDPLCRWGGKRDSILREFLLFCELIALGALFFALIWLKAKKKIPGSWVSFGHALLALVATASYGLTYSFNLWLVIGGASLTAALILIGCIERSKAE